jgi:predicted ATPase/signal transduction histidine kinase
MLLIPGFKIKNKTLGDTTNICSLKALRESDGLPVCIRAVTSLRDYKGIAKLKHEYEILKDLEIDGVIKAYSLIKAENIVALIFEDIKGFPLLSEYSFGKQSLKKTLQIMSEVVGIIHLIHQKKIIHRNINPTNILVNPLTGRALIVDFSIATSSLKGEETNRRIEGTYAYMSPEQTGRINRSVDSRTDLYSLGIIFYELLTGRLPFEVTQPLEWIHAHIAKLPEAPSKINPSLPKVVDSIVLKLLSKNAEDRYRSASGLLFDLGKCLEKISSIGQISPFELGTKDFYNEFRIPQKLYGRESELKKLLSTFDKVISSGQSEVLMISGYSGVGKTALVSEIHKPIITRRGYFISGKFDQYKQNVPYSALIQAYQDIIRQILTESEASVSIWRKKLILAMGRNAQVVINVIPELELIVGKQPDLPSLGTVEAENRFSLIFTEFQKILCQREHPVVMFLDDLQWVDSASLKMIQNMLIKNEMRYLFLIGAYRDNEVDQTHRLKIAIDEIEREKISIEHIILRPLSLLHTNQIISETIGSYEANSLPLGQIVFEKTKGNPFFLNQFLHFLHDNNLIFFNPEKESWSWDITQIQAQNMSENVVDFMTAKIQKLSQTTQDCLKLAACMGNTFDFKTLKTVSEIKFSDLVNSLHEGTNEGLISPLSDMYQILDQEEAVAEQSIPFRFLHDRVQQAFYQLIPESDKKHVHQKIGELLFKHTSDEQIDEVIFEIVNHLNMADDPTDTPFRMKLAKLNLRAGKKAKTSSAYEPALRYLKKGLSLLTLPEDWGLNYQICYDLHLEVAEIMPALSEFTEAEIIFKTIIEKAQTLYDKGIAYEKYSIFLQSSGRAYDGLRATKSALGLFGINFPNNPEARAIEVENLMEELCRPEVLGRMMKLPKGSAQNILIDRLYDRCNVATYFAQPEDLALVISKNVKHILDCGITPESGLAIAWFAMILGMMEKKELSFMYGDVGLEIMAQFDDPYFKGKTDMITYGQSLCWRDSFKESERKLNDAFTLCHSTGELQYASYARIISYISTVAQSSDCEYVLHSCQLWHDYCAKYVPLELGQAKIRLHLLQGLMMLPQEEIDPEKIITEYQLAKNATDVVESLVELARISTLMGKYKEGYNYFQRAEPIMIAGGAGNLLLVMLFYHGYSICCARLYVLENDTKYLSQLENYLAKLKVWAGICPNNFCSYYTLIEAEMARALKNEDLAIKFYGDTIRHAKKHEYILLQAYSNEYLGQIYLEKGNTISGAEFLDEAIYLYTQCGARGKVIQLLEIIRSLVSESPRTNFLSPANGNTAALDLETMMKSSEILSGTIVLDDFIKQALRIAMESAGAQRAVLITQQKKEMTVEADANLNLTNRLNSIPLDSYPLLPQSILNFVKRKREIVVLSDAHQVGDFTFDPYISKNKVKSVLCMPLLRQGNLIGILYLENNLATNVFAKKRIQILVMLSSQISISLENARFYDELEQKVKERTDQLEIQRVKVINASKFAMLSQMAGGVAHEINSPLYAINLNVRILEKMIEKKNIDLEQFTKYLSKILQTTERISGIVSSLMLFSREDQKLDSTLTDISKIISETLQLCHVKFTQQDIEIQFDKPLVKYITHFRQQQLMHVFMTLLNNSYDAIIESSSKKWIRFEIQEVDSQIEVRITDSGIPPEKAVQEKLFEPFFTTKEIGKGAGLGLCVAKAIMQEHLGDLTFDPTTPHTCFVVLMPKIN